jgi:hypothetical protein
MSSVGRGTSAGQVLVWDGEALVWQDPAASSLVGYTNNAPGYNTALGVGAGTVISSGVDNTFVGYNAGNLVTTGGNNLIAGFNAGAAMTTQSNNVALGASAMDVATGAYCTAVGRDAAYYGTGSFNVGVGYQAAKGSVSSSGAGNTAVGAYALMNYTSGSDNAAFGEARGHTSRPVFRIAR